MLPSFVASLSGVVRYLFVFAVVSSQQSSTGQRTVVRRSIQASSGDGRWEEYQVVLETISVCVCVFMLLYVLKSYVEYRFQTRPYLQNNQHRTTRQALSSECIFKTTASMCAFIFCKILTVFSLLISYKAPELKPSSLSCSIFQRIT